MLPQLMPAASALEVRETKLKLRVRFDISTDTNLKVGVHFDTSTDTKLNIGVHFDPSTSTLGCVSISNGISKWITRAQMHIHSMP
jgi:hypothetical protein